MAYTGKFKDRFCGICPAGLPNDRSATIADSFRDYRLQYQVDALKHDAGVFEERKTPFKYNLPILPTRHPGVLTEIRPILSLPVKTRYQTLINDLKETSYASYWNKLEGKSKDYVAGLPAGMIPEETTYGQRTPYDGPLRDIVNPPITPYEVSWNGQVGHELYKKTHNDYNPSEHRDRNYLKPAFDPNRRYGERSGYDPRGIWVRCACHWHVDEPIIAVSKIQADVKQQHEFRVGEVLAPINNIASVPKGHRFGYPTYRPMLGAESLLRDSDCPPCVFKLEFETWIKYLNELRVYLKNRFNKFGFCYKDFQDHVMHYDKEYTGWVPLDLFYALCECYQLHYEYKSLEPFFNFCGVIKDNLINYRDFVYLIDLNNSVPEIIKIENVPKKNQYYISTYKASACDYLFCDNSRSPKAGTPSYRFDLPYTTKPEGGCLAYIESLPDETTAGAVVNPSIYTHYGLSHRDFFKPQQPEVLKTLFEKLGYQFPGDTFQKLWTIGLERDKTGCVCISTFKYLLKETVPPSTFVSGISDPC